MAFPWPRCVIASKLGFRFFIMLAPARIARDATIFCSAAALRWRREDRGWRLEHVGGAIAEIVGREAEALRAGEPEWGTLVDGPDARAAVESAPAATRALTLRPSLRHADGTLRRVVEQIDIERDHEGRAVGFTSVIVRVEGVDAASAGIGVLAYVSHEVRTPLTGILGLAETLSRSPLSPDQRRLVAALREAGAALMGVVNEALDLSRVEAGAAKLVETEFRLGALCRSVADLHAGDGRADGPVLRVVGQPMDAALIGDAAKLRQVLGNLVGNAMKFTPRGVVEIGWRCEPAAAPGAVLARVSVRDTGVGIAPEAAARLFRPFAQTAEGEAAGGTGIGLAISRSLVELMGGRLWFESVPGEGSTFHVEAPFQAGRNAACAVIDGEARLASLGRRIAGAPPRLLVAEDCLSNRYLLEVMLRPLGARLDFVGDGAAAIEHLFAGRFDAVLMDSRMPVMGGVEATAEIRRLERERGGAHIPIVAFSADPERPSRAAFEAAGADEHIAKPFTADRLLGVLDKVLSRGGVVGSVARAV
jgi:signal transduction histidine kinase/CheY-like chemotaxis protein